MTDVQAWLDAFAPLCIGTVNPQALADELQNLRAAHAQRDKALAEKTLETLELRAALASNSDATCPALLQVHTLLLDPAVAHAFDTMRTALQSKTATVERLQSELQGVQYTSESKTGMMLVAKCRALQEENEELGRQLHEGHVGALERQLATAKAYIAELRSAYAELEAHCASLDAEAEGHLEGHVGHVGQGKAKRRQPI